MNVEIHIDPTIKESYFILHTASLSKEEQALVKQLQMHEPSIMSAQKDGKIYIFEPNDIYLIQSHQDRVYLYQREDILESKIRLYEYEATLPREFIRISKSSFINLHYIDHVEASFSGSMKVHMKNGMDDYISRRYLKQFKERIGLGGK